jgi:hypothetical protein
LPVFLNEFQDPDITREKENKWRRVNSFTTLEVRHQERVIFEYLIFDVYEGVKFAGVPRVDWFSHILDRYRERISTDILAYSREQMVQEWLNKAPLESRGIMDLEELERLKVLEKAKAKPERKRRNHNRHICESNVLPGSAGITRRFTRQMGRKP